MTLSTTVNAILAAEAEVLNISPHGIWLMVRGREYFLAFEYFPWFRNASIADVLAVELPQPDHLHWPSLDVDLHLDSIEHPERYPLIYGN